MRPPDNAKGGPLSETAPRKTLAREFDSSSSVKADHLEPIGIDESADFIRLEKVIERGIGTFLEVGAALAEIRDRRLYRCEYKTFDAYCREKWNMGRTYAHRLMAAAETVEMLPVGNKPTSERQVRALAKLPAEQRPEAWQRAVDRADGGQPTAVVVEAVVEEVEPQPKRTKRSQSPRFNGFYRVRLNIEMEEVLSVEPVEINDASIITLVVCSESQARHLLNQIKPPKFSRLIWQAARSCRP